MPRTVSAWRAVDYRRRGSACGDACTFDLLSRSAAVDPRHLVAHAHNDASPKSGAVCPRTGDGRFPDRISHLFRGSQSAVVCRPLRRRDRVSARTHVPSTAPSRHTAHKPQHDSPGPIGAWLPGLDKTDRSGETRPAALASVLPTSDRGHLLRQGPGQHSSYPSPRRYAASASSMSEVGGGSTVFSGTSGCCLPCDSPWLSCLSSLW